MASTRDIKRRLVSVKNTRKITYAMKLVSAAKLRRAQESVVKSREYTTALNKMLNELMQEAGDKEFSHPLAEVRPVKNVGIIVIGGSRGLSGAYNTNVNRRIESAYKEVAAKHPGAQIKATVIGRKPAEYFRRTNKPYIESHEQLPEDANKWPIAEICLKAERQFMDGEIDELYIIFTHFKSALSMTVEFKQLLPMEGVKNEGQQAVPGQTIVEPSLERVYLAAMARVMRSKVRQAALDAKAGEQASRMTAMDAATKNAGDLTKKLQLQYNKLRQANITSELLDIIGGAEAIK